MSIDARFAHQQGNLVVGSMCSDIPILSSFIPEDYAEYSLTQKYVRKQQNMHDAKLKKFQEMAMKRANKLAKEQKTNYKLSKEPSEVEKKPTELETDHVRESRFSKFYAFFIRHPLFQNACFILLVAITGIALSFLQDGLAQYLLPMARHELLERIPQIHLKIVVHIIWTVVFSLIGTCLCLNISPDAGAGSGIPDIRAILSGIHFPQFMTFRTMLGKLLTSLFIVSSGLFCERGGPLLCNTVIATHLYMTFIPFFRNFKETESLRRNMYSFAVAMGLAVVTGSPIGGVLFSIELMSDVFLTQNYARLFFASGFASLFWRLLQYLEYSPFSKPHQDTPPPAQFHEWLVFIAFGVVVGFVAQAMVKMAYYTALIYRWWEAKSTAQKKDKKKSALMRKQEEQELMRKAKERENKRKKEMKIKEKKEKRRRRKEAWKHLTKKEKTDIQKLREDKRTRRKQKLERRKKREAAKKIEMQKKIRKKEEGDSAGVNNHEDQANSKDENELSSTETSSSIDSLFDITSSSTDLSDYDESPAERSADTDSTYEDEEEEEQDSDSLTGRGSTQYMTRYNAIDSSWFTAPSLPRHKRRLKERTIPVTFVGATSDATASNPHKSEAFRLEKHAKLTAACQRASTHRLQLEAEKDGEQAEMQRSESSAVTRPVARSSHSDINFPFDSSAEEDFSIDTARHDNLVGMAVQNERTEQQSPSISSSLSPNAAAEEHLPLSLSRVSTSTSPLARSTTPYHSTYGHHPLSITNLPSKLLARCNKKSSQHSPPSQGGSPSVSPPLDSSAAPFRSSPDGISSIQETNTFQLHSAEHRADEEFSSSSPHFDGKQTSHSPFDPNEEATSASATLTAAGSAGAKQCSVNKPKSPRPPIVIRDISMANIAAPPNNNTAAGQPNAHQAAHKPSLATRMLSHFSRYSRRYILVCAVALLNGFLTIPYSIFSFAGTGTGALLYSMLGSPDSLDELISFSPEERSTPMLPLLVVFVIKFILCPLCLQLPVPSGAVMSSLLLGGLMGRILGEGLYHLAPELFPSPATYAAVGGAAFLASSTQAVSPALIVMEMTNLPNVHLPVVFGTIAACYVGRGFGDSFYDIVARLRRIPMLSARLPSSVAAEFLTAGDLMKHHKIFLFPRSTLAAIRKAVSKAKWMGVEAIPLVRSESDPVLLGAVRVESLEHMLSNAHLLESAIVQSINCAPLCVGYHHAVFRDEVKAGIEAKKRKYNEQLQRKAEKERRQKKKDAEKMRKELRKERKESLWRTLSVPYREPKNRIKSVMSILSSQPSSRVHSPAVAFEREDSSNKSTDGTYSSRKRLKQKNINSTSSVSSLSSSCASISPLASSSSSTSASSSSTSSLAGSSSIPAPSSLLPLEEWESLTQQERDRLAHEEVVRRLKMAHVIVSESEVEEEDDDEEEEEEEAEREEEEEEVRNFEEEEEEGRSQNEKRSEFDEMKEEDGPMNTESVGRLRRRTISEFHFSPQSERVERTERKQTPQIPHSHTQRETLSRSNCQRIEPKNTEKEVKILTFTLHSNELKPTTSIFRNSSFHTPQFSYPFGLSQPDTRQFYTHVSRSPSIASLHQQNFAIFPSPSPSLPSQASVSHTSSSGSSLYWATSLKPQSYHKHQYQQHHQQQQIQRQQEPVIGANYSSVYSFNPQTQQHQYDVKRSIPSEQNGGQYGQYGQYGQSIARLSSMGTVSSMTSTSTITTSTTGANDSLSLPLLRQYRNLLLLPSQNVTQTDAGSPYSVQSEAKKTHYRHHSRVPSVLRSSQTISFTSALQHTYPSSSESEHEWTPQLYRADATNNAVGQSALRSPRSTENSPLHHRLHHRQRNHNHSRNNSFTICDADSYSPSPVHENYMSAAAFASRSPSSLLPEVAATALDFEGSKEVATQRNAESEKESQMQQQQRLQQPLSDTSSYSDQMNNADSMDDLLTPLRSTDLIASSSAAASDDFSTEQSPSSNRKDPPLSNSKSQQQLQSDQKVPSMPHLITSSYSQDGDTPRSVYSESSESSSSTTSSISSVSSSVQLPLTMHLFNIHSKSHHKLSNQPRRLVDSTSSVESTGSNDIEARVLNSLYVPPADEAAQQAQQTQQTQHDASADSESESDLSESASFGSSSLNQLAFLGEQDIFEEQTQLQSRHSNPCDTYDPSQTLFFAFEVGQSKAKEISAGLPRPLVFQDSEYFDPAVLLSASGSSVSNQHSSPFSVDTHSCAFRIFTSSFIFAFKERTLFAFPSSSFDASFVQPPAAAQTDGMGLRSRTTRPATPASPLPHSHTASSKNIMLNSQIAVSSSSLVPTLLLTPRQMQFLSSLSNEMQTQMQSQTQSQSPTHSHSYSPTHSQAQTQAHAPSLALIRHIVQHRFIPHIPIQTNLNVTDDVLSEWVKIMRLKRLYLARVIFSKYQQGNGRKDKRDKRGLSLEDVHLITSAVSQLPAQSPSFQVYTPNNSSNTISKGADGSAFFVPPSNRASASLSFSYDLSQPLHQSKIDGNLLSSSSATFDTTSFTSNIATSDESNAATSQPTQNNNSQARLNEGFQQHPQEEHEPAPVLSHSRSLFIPQPLGKREPFDDSELAEIDLTSSFVMIDPTPFNMSVKTPLSKAHALFHLLALDHCLVTYEGRFVGFLFKSDFTELYVKDYIEKELRSSAKHERKKKRKHRKHQKTQ